MITYGSTTLTSYNTITKIEVYYYKSTSATSLSGGSWSTTKPTWENGKYIWQKIRTTYEGKLENGQYYSESDPVNITGQQGQQGETGASAYSYKLNVSDTIISVSKNGTYSTNSVTFSATSKQGNEDVNSYEGRFKIETTMDGITWITQYISSADESSKIFTIPSDISNIRCSLYQAGGTTVLLDITSVSIVRDGIDGALYPNLSPFFSHDLTDIYNAETNPNGYWMEYSSYGWTKNSKFTFTQLEDGWLHVHIDNSSGTSLVRNDCCILRYNPSIKKGTMYTFLTEFRNNQSTGIDATSNFYLVQQSGGRSVQFWGINTTTAPSVKLEGIGGLSIRVIDIPSDGSYAIARGTKYSEPEDSSSHWTTEDAMATFTFRANAGAVIDYDIRLSMYEGEYWGNYVPYIISDVTDIRNSAEMANNKIDNLEIGGRNLLRFSENMDNWTLGTNSSIVDGEATVIGSSSNWDGRVNTLKMDLDLLDGETKYLLSFDYKSIKDTIPVIVIAGTSRYIEENEYTRTKYTNWISSITFPSTNGEWKRFTLPSRTISISDLTTGSGDVNSWYLQFYNHNDTTIVIKRFKLERGNKATDWTPAPEDITRGTGFYAITTAPTTYTTPIHNFNPSYRVALTTVKTESGLNEVMVGDVIQQGYNTYPVGYVDDSYVYLGTVNSIRGATGAAGLNTARVILYRRFASAPTGTNVAPTGDVIYTFATGVAKNNLNSWTQNIPSGTDPVYMIAASASNTGATDTIPKTEWSTPVKILENGQNGSPGNNGLDGYNQATIYLYQRANTIPNQPTSEVMYTFSSGALSPAPSGWYRTIPENNGNPCYVITATAIAKTSTYTIRADDWSDVVVLSQDGESGKDGINGTSQNLLLDVYATSLAKVKAPWSRYFSDASNTTITSEFIAEDNLPDPNATHFIRFTDSSATTKGKALCFYSGGTPPFLNGHTYKVGCWVRKHAGQPRINIYLGGVYSWTNTKTITNTEWEWVECVHTFGDTDPSINAQPSTYKRLYFYFYNKNVEGSSLDMCGFKAEEIQINISTARNYLLKTKKLEGWGVTNGTTINDGIATFPEVTANTWREVYSAKNFKYELIRNKNIIFSVKVKADMNKICCCNLCIGVDSTETAYARQKYALNPMYFTGTADWQTICLAVPMSDEYFTSGSGTPDYDDCWVTVRIGAYNNYWNGFQIKEPQLSLGTTATAWSAAPEDVSADIQQVQDNLDNLEIGGRNLIIGTLNPIATGGTGIYRPHLSGQITNTGGRGTCTVAEHGLRFTNTTANWEYIYFGSSADTTQPCMLGLEAGQTYTLSADLSWNILSSDTGKANTNTYGMGALLAYSSETNPNNFVTAVSNYPLLITQADKGTDMSGRLVFTFTVPSDAIRLYLGIRANNTAATHYAIGDYLEARNLKLEKGSKATDWTPAPEDVETEITSLEENLKSQIDEKIQTFYQATNPADSWNEGARSAHNGDLWYYTGNTTATYTKDNVYRYNALNNTWTVYSASGELFDKIDGKTTIYYGTTSGIYTDVKIGDYLVDSTDGSSYRYDGSNWVKVTDYKTGIDAAQASADTANDKIDNLEIGGRNLILDTAIERISPASANNSAYVMPAPMMSDYASGILNNRNDYFTYSFDYEVTGNEASGAYIYVQIRGGSVPSTSDGYYSYVLENPTGKYCCTFKLTEAQATGTYKGCGIRLKNATDGAVLRVWNVKLERGTRATDWTPAPEDAQAEINTALSQSIWYATCDTAGDVLIKEATITPTVDNFTLNVGTTVNVKFENANAGDRNSLKLKINDTEAKDIRYMNNATMVAIPSNEYIIAGGTYLFVYDGTYWVIQNLNYNTNDNYYDRRRHNNAIKAKKAITQYSLIGGNESGYENITASMSFDLGYPILYASAAIKINNTATTTYEAMSAVNFSVTGTIQNGAANKMLWLKGTIRGNTFTVASTNFLTTLIPTSDDGMYYIPLGIMVSATTGYFSSSNRIYAYVDDAFQPLDNAAALTAIQARSEIVQTQETLSLQIRDISIGGANLFEKTKSFEGIANGDNTHDALTEFIYKDLTVRYANTVTFNNSIVELSAYQFTNLTSDTWYTFSFYAKGNVDIGFMYAGSGNAVIDSISVSWNDETYTGFNTTSISSNIIWLTPTDKWQRYNVTFHVEEQDITALHRLIGLYARPVSDNVELITETKDILRTESGTDVHFIMEGNEISICGYKLELGNKPTDWTPSDKDKAGYDNIISQINLSQEGIAIRADKIRFEGMITANEGFSIDEYGNMTANNGTFNGVFESYATEINENTFDLSINNGHIHFYNNDRTLTDDARHVGYIGGIRNSVSYISGEEKINDAIIIRLDNDCDFIIDSQETSGTERVLRVTNHSNNYISVDYWKDLHVYLGKKIQMYGYENNQYPEIIFKRYISDTNQYITRGTLALHSATGTSDINDRLYLYAKNQGDDLAGDQYLYFAGKGLKYSSSGQSLRTGYVATHKYIVTQQFSITDQTITKGSSQNFEIDVTRDGYTPIMCTVTATNGTGAFYLSIYHWTIIGNTVKIFTHNNSTTTDAANITIWVNVLYKLTY